MFKKKKQDGPQNELHKKASVTGTYRIALEKLDEQMQKAEETKEKAKNLQQSVRQTISGIFKPEPT